MGKLLSDAEEMGLKYYSQQLLQDCADIPEIFGKLLWLILPFSALIFSMFIFDTHGDQVTWRHAYPLPLVMCLMPFFFLLLRMFYKSPKIKPIVDRYLEWIRLHVPFAWILLKSRPEEIGLRATIIVSSYRKMQSVVPESNSQSNGPSNSGPLKSETREDFEEGKLHRDGMNEDLRKVDENRQPVGIIDDLDIEEMT